MNVLKELICFKINLFTEEITIIHFDFNQTIF